MSYCRSAHPWKWPLLQRVNSYQRFTRLPAPTLCAPTAQLRHTTAIRWAVQVAVLWDAHNVEHIARHGVTPNEVEEVVRTNKARWFTDDTVRLGRLVVLGATTTGRLLVIVLDRPAPSGVAYCVTARPMSPRERQDYERANE